jgi:hypothetical protein
MTWAGLKGRQRPGSPSTRKKYVEDFVKLIDNSAAAQQLLFRRLKKGGTISLMNSEESDEEEKADQTFKLTSKSPGIFSSTNTNKWMNTSDF